MGGVAYVVATAGVAAGVAGKAPPAAPKPASTNCVNCGAPHEGAVCAYCGTRHGSPHKAPTPPPSRDRQPELYYDQRTKQYMDGDRVLSLEQAFALASTAGTRKHIMSLMR